MSIPVDEDVSAPLPAGLPSLPQVDLAHSRQVTRLATAIFDAVSRPLGLDQADRLLLAVAALWHDSGQAIRDQGHHKHSYTLIMGLHLPQFTSLQKQQIALIARYHRKALPNPGHEAFAALPAAAQQRVCRLAALLRIADGLDYTHRGLVRAVRAEVRPGLATFTAQAGREAEAEVQRAWEKADLFTATFGVVVEVRRAGCGAAG